MFYAQLLQCPLDKTAAALVTLPPKNKHQDIKFQVVPQNICSCDWVLTVLWGQNLKSGFFFLISLHFTFKTFDCVCCTARTAGFVCACVSVCVRMQMEYRDLWRALVCRSRTPELWQTDWIRPRVWGKGEGELERAPGKLPLLCLQQKAIVWCGRTAGSKAPAPTGCALPDGGHCEMTSTKPYWYYEQKPLETKTNI